MRTPPPPGLTPSPAATPGGPSVGPGLGREPPTGPRLLRQRDPCRTCAPHAAAARPSPPRPPLPAVSSSLDTETPEPSREKDEQLASDWDSPWASMLLASLQSSRSRPGCRKKAGEGGGARATIRGKSEGRGEGGARVACGEGGP